MKRLLLMPGNFFLSIHANKKVERLFKLLGRITASTKSLFLRSWKTFLTLISLLAEKAFWSRIDLLQNSCKRTKVGQVEVEESERTNRWFISRKHKRLIYFWYFISLNFEMLKLLFFVFLFFFLSPSLFLPFTTGVLYFFYFSLDGAFVRILTRTKKSGLFVSHAKYIFMWWFWTRHWKITSRRVEKFGWQIFFNLAVFCFGVVMLNIDYVEL